MIALKNDPRIGPNAYLSPSLGVAGGNIPRDLNVLTKQAEKLPDFYSCFLEALKSFNYDLGSWVRDSLLSITSRDKSFKSRIGVLGLTYKPHTASLANAPSLKLFQCLPKETFSVFDPVIASLPGLNNVIFLASTEEVLANNNVIILMTPWPEVLESILQLDAPLKDLILIDPFAALGEEHINLFQKVIQRGMPRVEL
jgi:UDPglucose 6-dehydrogenase